jgi:hypothetical protein
MNLLFPSFKLRLLPQMLGVACLGAIVAGVYGSLHDQVTYSISHEYFTCLKFHQFRYADFGLPTRIFVAEIGFLATWWVGLIAAWFLVRIALPTWPLPVALRKCLVGFGIIAMISITAAFIGYVMGVCHSSDYSLWRDACLNLGVTDIPAFVRVAYIHNASYIGGLLGLVVAIAYLLRQKHIETGSRGGRH